MIINKMKYTLWTHNDNDVVLMFKGSKPQEFCDNYLNWKITKLNILPAWYAFAALCGDVMADQDEDWSEIPRKYYDEREC